VVFACDFHETEVNSVTWYFGDGTSFVCTKDAKGRWVGSTSHSYSTPSRYFAYAVADNGERVKVKNINVVAESAFSWIGFLLLALGFSTHLVARKLEINS